MAAYNSEREISEFRAHSNAIGKISHIYRVQT